MRENSIKEDIKIVENYLANSAMNEIDSNFFKNSGWETVDLEIPKSMRHILSDYKRVAEENEELKFKERSRIIGKYGDVEIHDLINRTLLNDYIPIQKAKDKIEKYKNMCISNVKGCENYFKDNYDEVVYRRMEQLEKELLEREE